MNLRPLLAPLAACALIAIAPAVSGAAETSQGAPSRPPNIIVILSDDQGWGDLSVNGNRNLSTPHIDSLARDGALLEHFYVCPVCAPTRAEFLTGRYYTRCGVRGVSRGEERLNLDERTLADDLKAAGYATGIFGKWHNGSQYPYHPNGRGFDEFYGFTSGHWGDYFDAPVEHNAELERSQGYLADDLTDHAMRFIEEKRGQPFFCYLAFNTPHSPFQVPDKFYARFKDAEIAQRADPAGGETEEIDKTRAVLAMCENMDWNVGRLLARLDELKLADDAILVFFGDNGPNTWRWNGGMKGRKGSTDEGGVRSPCMIRWPGRIPAGSRVLPIAGAIDLLPTLTDLAGVMIPPGKPLDGWSLKPLLLGDPAGNVQEGRPWYDRFIFSHYEGKTSARYGRFFRLDAKGGLYNVEADPGQTREVAAEFRDVAAHLRGGVAAWRSGALPKLPDDRPFPVGYREFPVAHLPARDGDASGGVRRSDRAPNCSYFTNWKTLDGRITWDIEAHEAGDYEAVVFYACAPKNLGAEIELAFGDPAASSAKIAAVVTEPNDPPAVGAEHDRAPRGGESLVKDFKPMRLGVIRLPAGRAPLTLRALKIPGEEAMEVRMVQLRLLIP